VSPFHLQSLAPGVEYFDASLIGLTATPSKQTFGFFNKNLVMEYNHEKAVADGVNGCDIYRINTAITQGGSKVDAGFYVDKRTARRARSVGSNSTKCSPTAPLTSTRTSLPPTRFALSLRPFVTRMAASSTHGCWREDPTPSF